MGIASPTRKLAITLELHSTPETSGAVKAFRMWFLPTKEDRQEAYQTKWRWRVIPYYVPSGIIPANVQASFSVLASTMRDLGEGRGLSFVWFPEEEWTDRLEPVLALEPGAFTLYRLDRWLLVWFRSAEACARVLSEWSVKGYRLEEPFIADGSPRHVLNLMRDAVGTAGLKDMLRWHRENPTGFSWFFEVEPDFTEVPAVTGYTVQPNHDFIVRTAQQAANQFGVHLFVK